MMQFTLPIQPQDLSKITPYALQVFFFFFLRGGVDSLDELQLKLYLKNNKSIKKIRSELDVRESVLLQN